MSAGSLFLKRLVLAAFSTIFAVVVVALGYEGFERIKYKQWHDSFDGWGWMNTATIPSPDKKLMWEYRAYGQYGNMQFNRWGFRDYDWPVQEKPKDVYRVAFAGDSVTMAMLVDYPKGFTARYQVGVNAIRRPRRVQALNFSVDGYNAPQVEEMIRVKTMPFEPDKVEYVLCLNDFDFSDSSGFKILYFNPPRSFLWDKIQKTLQARSNTDFHVYHFNKNKETVYQSIINMKKTVEAAGAKFEVVVIPVFPFHLPNYDGYVLYGVHDEIGRFLQSQQIKYVDLLYTFKTTSRPVNYWALDIWHPTEAGHQLIAGTLLKAISID